MFQSKKKQEDSGANELDSSRESMSFQTKQPIYSLSPRIPASMQNVFTSQYNQISKKQPMQHQLAQLWKVVIQIQYTEEIQDIDLHVPMIPICVKVYEKFIQLLRMALGDQYESDYFVAKPP